jgi:four helix bundle protein
MVEKLRDLRVYVQAERYCNAVFRLCTRPGFRRDRKLRVQVESANESIKANIAEGFEQGSDAQFVKYLEYSKGARTNWSGSSTNLSES